MWFILCGECKLILNSDRKKSEILLCKHFELCLKNRDKIIIFDIIYVIK